MLKKRVLVISNMYPTDTHKSFGIFVKNQVQALKAEGLLVDVIAIDNPESGKLNVLKKYIVWAIQVMFNLLFKGYKYDIIHAHYVFPSGFLGMLYKKIWKKRVVVTSHGGDIDKMARKNEKIYNLTKKTLKGADHVIAVGEVLYTTINEEFGVPKEAMSLLNMGVNRDVFKPLEKDDAKRQCQVRPDAPSLLFVGNIIEQKGLLELVEATAAIKATYPKIKLYLIGAVKDRGFKQRLDENIRKADLLDQVEFLNVMPQTEIAKWMAAADVFVLPSHIEGFGLVALEAMACGTPVVASDAGGLKYLLSEHTGELTAAKDVQSLTKGIMNVIENQEYSHRLTANGLEKASENDQEKLTRRVINEVYFPTGG